MRPWLQENEATFFLFMVKCPVVAKDLRRKNGDIVLMANPEKVLSMAAAILQTGRSSDAVFRPMPGRDLAKGSFCLFRRTRSTDWVRTRDPKQWKKVFTIKGRKSGPARSCCLLRRPERGRLVGLRVTAAAER